MILDGTTNTSRRFLHHEEDPLRVSQGGRFFQRPPLLKKLHEGDRFAKGPPSPKEMKMRLPIRRWRCAIALSFLVLASIAGFAQAEPFTDVSADSGAADKGRGKGVAWADVDGDGFLDLFVSNKGGPSRLFLNNGNGAFRDVTEEAGLEETGFAMGSCFGDVNNDGKPDLYVAKGGRYEIESNRLYFNASAPGHPKFVDITESAGVGIKTFTYGSTMFDYDRDGRLDIYCSNYGVGQHNYLFRNLTAGPRPEDVKFVDVTDRAGVGSRLWAWSSTAFDYDGDGWDDIVVSNGRYPAGEKKTLYRNMGDGTFRDVAAEAGVGDENWTLGIGVGDINNDGWPDLYVSNYVGRNRMYLNLGNGKFKDISKESRTDNDGWGKGPAFGDTDHDGFLDLYEGDCKFSNQFYHNNGDLTFADIVEKYPFMKLETIRSKGSAFADIDNDGDLDLYVVNWEVANGLFRNEQNDGNWIKVKAEGTTFGDASRGLRSSRDAVGAKVRLYRDGRLVAFREVMVSNGFVSNPPLEVHFGVDGKARYDIEVEFPSGIKVLRRDAAAGEGYLVREIE
jgi:hypothetical protein